MKMKHWFALLSLVFIFFFSCSGNKKELKISEKDIEGYWVSGFLLHNTDLSRSIASDNSKKPKVLLLRLKNSVNGFADTSYRIHGDTLFYRIKFNESRIWDDSLLRSKEKFYSLRITFHSKDRLVVMDDNTHQETTYYNLSILPVIQERIKEISFGVENKIIIKDSIKLYPGFLRPNIKTDVSWNNDLNVIVQHINWKGALLARESVKAKSQALGEFSIEMYDEGIPSHISIGIITEKHTGSWNFRSQYVSDPALSALIAELKTFEMYCYANNLLHHYIIL
jgi:hypothetical protein